MIITPSPFRKALDDRKSGSPHKYGCLMLKVPGALAWRIGAWAKGHIDPSHLAPDGMTSPWDMHVTLKYGFPDGSVRAEELRAALSHMGPFPARIVKCSQFPDRGDGAVLKLDVQSAQLMKAYHVISRRFKAVDKWYPDYKPHVTVAYLKPEHADLYRSLPCPFLLQAMSLETAVYSTPSGSESHFGLRRRKALSWVAGAGSHLVAEPAWMGPEPRKPRSKSIPPSPFRPCR